ELKSYPNKQQKISINDALRTTQFIRNKAVRQWLDGPKNNTKENNTKESCEEKAANN
ncbi:hypothetical protein LCGC14_3037020, partial [marine sediment metagenome]